MQVVGKRLNMDPTFSIRSPLQFDDLRELMEASVKTMYLHLETKMFIKKEGLALDNSLSPLISNIFNVYPG
jgi:hypothetical protein